MINIEYGAEKQAEIYEDYIILRPALGLILSKFTIPEELVKFTPKIYDMYFMPDKYRSILHPELKRELPLELRQEFIKMERVTTLRELSNEINCSQQDFIIEIYNAMINMIDAFVSARYIHVDAHIGNLGIRRYVRPVESVVIDLDCLQICDDISKIPFSFKRGMGFFSTFECSYLSKPYHYQVCKESDSISLYKKYRERYNV